MIENDASAHFLLHCFVMNYYYGKDTAHSIKSYFRDTSHNLYLQKYNGVNCETLMLEMEELLEGGWDRNKLKQIGTGKEGGRREWDYKKAMKSRICPIIMPVLAASDASAAFRHLVSLP